MTASQGVVDVWRFCYFELSDKNVIVTKPGQAVQNGQLP